MPREDPRAHATRQWLAKALEDLGLAEFLVRSSSFPAATVYHCQQATEKALKAILVWHNQPFRKTHDLVELGGQCVALDQGLEPFLRQAAPLTDYAWTPHRTACRGAGCCGWTPRASSAVWLRIWRPPYKYAVLRR